MLTSARAKTLGVVDGTPAKANTSRFEVAEPWLFSRHVDAYELLDVNELFEVDEVASSVQQLSDFGSEDRSLALHVGVRLPALENRPWFPRTRFTACLCRDSCRYFLCGSFGRRDSRVVRSARRWQIR